MHRTGGNVGLLLNVHTKADLMQSDRLFQQLAALKLKAASSYVHFSLATPKRPVWDDLRGRQACQRWTVGQRDARLFKTRSKISLWIIQNLQETDADKKCLHMMKFIFLFIFWEQLPERPVVSPQSLCVKQWALQFVCASQVCCLWLDQSAIFKVLLH